MSALNFFAKKGITDHVDAAIILGSGLGGFVSGVQQATVIPYNEIPDFPVVTVAGHGGELIFGTVSGKRVMVFSGRFHHYEGHPFERTVLPVELAARMGATRLIVSNAAGGINLTFRVGDFMLIEDVMRIGFPVMPLKGASRLRFDAGVTIRNAKEIARLVGVDVRQGTYLYVKGPVYETRAEIQAYRLLGADAVGMSTMPELITAASLNMETIGISLITNMATGVNEGKLAHTEIKDVAESRKEAFSRLVQALV